MKSSFFSRQSKTSSLLGAGGKSHPLSGGGFTLIELLTVLGIVAALSLVSFLSISGQKNKVLGSTAKQMVSVIREAQSRSVSQVNGMAWGVYFENSTTTATSSPFFTIFSGTTYTPSSQLSRHNLSDKVAYVTASIAVGASKEVNFAQISGMAGAATSISIYLKTNPNVSSTITVGASGAVSY
ncbi:MAG: type II secretion system protein [Candidatus Liptonbacteria bacterium]|nr:type II secretion system protein [Candidatus Liptonbacteria bacterium]